MGDVDAWKEEERRQSRILAERIQGAIDAAAAEMRAAGHAPLINAVAGALVSVEAGMLASVSTPGRKALRAAMDRARSKALAAALTRNPGKAQTVVVGRSDA